MKNATRLLCTAGLAMGLAGFATGASAQDHAPGNVYNDTEFKTGLYVGGGLGWGWSDRSDDWSWKGVAGWRLNQYAAVQTFYADLGDHGAPGVIGETGVDTYGAELLLSFPVAQNLAVYGKGGVHQYKIDTRNTSWLAGGGLEYGLGEGWSLRGEWTHYDLDPIDSDDFTLQVVYGF